MLLVNVYYAILAALAVQVASVRTACLEIRPVRWTWYLFRCGNLLLSVSLSLCLSFLFLFFSVCIRMLRLLPWRAGGWCCSLLEAIRHRRGRPLQRSVYLVYFSHFQRVRLAIIAW